MFQGTRLRMQTLSAGLVLVALLVLPASAAAGTKSASATTSGHFAIASATAKCPGGQRATGGGFTATPPPLVLFEPLINVYESRKIGQRSWRVSGQVYDFTAPTGAPFGVTAYAYCSRGASSTKSKTSSVTSVGPAIPYIADAKCKSGQAQAGGFVGPPPNNTGPAGGWTHNVTDSYRIGGRTWRARMSSTIAGARFTSYVYCSDDTKPVARSGSITAATNHTQHTALSTECKRGTKLVSGGFSQPNATQIRFYKFYESFKSGKRWRVSAEHSGNSSTTLNSIAYCG